MNKLTKKYIYYTITFIITFCFAIYPNSQGQYDIWNLFNALSAGVWLTTLSYTNLINKYKKHSDIVENHKQYVEIPYNELSKTVLNFKSIDELKLFKSYNPHILKFGHCLNPISVKINELNYNISLTASDNYINTVTPIDSEIII